jgi:hypothetical protein
MEWKVPGAVQEQGTHISIPKLTLDPKKKKPKKVSKTRLRGGKR